MSTTRLHAPKAPATDRPNRPADADCGVLLLGHGASAPGAAAVLARQAERIRAAMPAADVRWAVFVGKPGVTAVLGAMHRRTVHVIPYFMSGGGYAAMCFDICREADRDYSGRRTFLHHPPIGLEPAVSDLMQAEAARAAGMAGIDLENALLLLVAHGSSKRAASRQAVLSHVDRIAGSGRFRKVRAVFLEEPPTLAEVLGRQEGPAIVVGHLAGGGHHAEFDIPAALRGARRPVVYAGCVGEHPAMAQIVAERVALRQPADAA